MNYDYLTEEELMREVSALAKQMSALSSQAEKLSALQKDKKVPSVIYGEIFEDLVNKIHSSRRTIDAVMMATRDRTNEVGEEASRLKTQLELLEVRHAIGSVSDDKYKVWSEHALNQLQQSENMVKEMEGLIAIMQGCLNRFNAEKLDSPQPTIKAIPVDQVEQAIKEEVVQANSPVTKEVERSPQPAGGVMSCQRCGNKGPSTAHFCSNCGSRF